MADPNRQSGDGPTIAIPTQNDSPHDTASPTTEHNEEPPANGAGAEATMNSPGAAAGPVSRAGERREMPREAQEVLGSDIGVSTMINRLKQSVASAKEFALFLKKRASLEEDHARGLKKLCGTTRDSIHRMDHRQGSFMQSYEDMLVIHERMAENGLQFSQSLQQMHDDLLEIAVVSEKNRKGWKQNGLAAEQRLSDIENAMRKSKAKYDSLAEDYDRVRTGESRQGGRFGFKGPKSAAQHEEDLLRKVQAADTDYMGKVQNYQSEKATVVATTRPEAIRALQDLVRECDSATMLQMQKFASFNEKLLLSDGLVISPLKNQNRTSSHGPRSLKEVIQAVDNNKDLEEYLLSFYNKVPPKGSEPKYERNPVLNPQHNISAPRITQMPPPQQQQPLSHPMGSPQIPPPGSMGARSGPFDMTAPGAPEQHWNAPSMPAAQRSHERSFSHGDMLTQSTSQTSFNPRNSASAIPPSHQRFESMGSNIGQSGPPQLGALPFQTSQPQAEPSPPLAPSMLGPSDQQQPGSARSASPPSTTPSAPKPKQVFGVSLGRLYERDGLAVPMVVYQCIQAVDLYGLAVEGIYRLSGSTAHVQKLKNMFDTDSDSRNLDFRNPENFFHDVNSVAGLLKAFFRDLPDPLFTGEHYAAFVEAAKHEDDIVRRDSLHAIINSLPDPNYATLRALTLHLYRVMDNSSVNRMNSQNLAIVFGPTLMGTAPGSNIADAGWQVRAIDTILQNTYQIFDDD